MQYTNISSIIFSKKTIKSPKIPKKLTFTKLLQNKDVRVREKLGIA